MSLMWMGPYLLRSGKSQGTLLALSTLSTHKLMSRLYTVLVFQKADAASSYGTLFRPQSPPGPPPAVGMFVPQSPPGPPPAVGMFVPQSPPGPPPAVGMFVPQSPPDAPPSAGAVDIYHTSQEFVVGGRAEPEDSDSDDDIEVLRILAQRKQAVGFCNADGKVWDQLDDKARKDYMDRAKLLADDLDEEDYVPASKRSRIS
jgi:hypothetical protein